MSDHSPTFDTPSHNFGDDFERKREAADYAVQDVQDFANSYIGDLEHALSEAEAERLELYDALTNLRDDFIGENFAQADEAIANYRAKMR